MMSPLWIAIVSIIFVIIAAYLVITKILPKIRDLLEGLMSGKPMAGFMSLLIIVVYILIFSKIISLLLEVDGNKYLAYLSLISPGIDILIDILPYVKYILLGVLIAWGFQCCKK